jgi:hypothetical protein
VNLSTIFLLVPEIRPSTIPGFMDGGARKVRAGEAAAGAGLGVMATFQGRLGQSPAPDKAASARV